MSKHKQHSTITGRVVNTTILTESGLISFQQSAQTARNTEIQALAALHAPKLTELQAELLRLEHAGKQAAAGSGLVRGLHGVALLKWIAGRIGMTWRDVESELEVITRVLEAQAKGGL